MTDHYPKWAWELHHFLGNTLIDHIDPEGVDDEITDKVEEAALAIVCKEYGHLVTDDQCMIPDHRFCIMCGSPMPSIPIGQYKEESHD